MVPESHRPHYRESFPANNKKSMQMWKFSTPNDLHYTVAGKFGRRKLWRYDYGERRFGKFRHIAKYICTGWKDLANFSLAKYLCPFISVISCGQLCTYSNQHYGYVHMYNYVCMCVLTKIIRILWPGMRKPGLRAQNTLVYILVNISFSECVTQYL